MGKPKKKSALSISDKQHITTGSYVSPQKLKLLKELLQFKWIYSYFFPELFIPERIRDTYSANTVVKHLSKQKTVKVSKGGTAYIYFNPFLTTRILPEHSQMFIVGYSNANPTEKNPKPTFENFVKLIEDNEFAIFNANRLLSGYIEINALNNNMNSSGRAHIYTNYFKHQSKSVDLNEFFSVMPISQCTDKSIILKAQVLDENDFKLFGKNEVSLHHLIVLDNFQPDSFISIDISLGYEGNLISVLGGTTKIEPPSIKTYIEQLINTITFNPIPAEKIDEFQKQLKAWRIRKDIFEHFAFQKIKSIDEISKLMVNIPDENEDIFTNLTRKGRNLVCDQIQKAHIYFANPHNPCQSDTIVETDEKRKNTITDIRTAPSELDA